MKNRLLPTALFFFLIIVFSGCEKTDDDDRLEGTTWVAVQDGVAFTLHFADESTCTVATSRADGAFSANLTTYSWRYRELYESATGHFLLYIAEEGDTAASQIIGAIEGKALLLSGLLDDEILRFERQ